ncbi:protein translocase subunit secF [Micromonospora pattaloongensis]|uniref:Protein-export membrane protein SecF n=1 Tax=Micromonospora pattaloongensis TaxID=405436 RepID=A0A1H3S571_9ACTN|nr:protein translocase subunit SecF [Micromonospora pattaloongensis]SDZ33024.1 protein translocase subunit secF [Micromonospora pattaloongensis]
MARSGLATRLYRGEAGLNVVGRRKTWFAVAAGLVLVAILSFAFRGFSLGIEFKGGNEFQVPVSVGTMQQAEDAVNAAIGALPGESEGHVVSAQQVGNATYLLRTTELSGPEATQVQQKVADEFGIPAADISSNQVSAAWGGQATERGVLGLVVFVALVMVYLILRFEWRMALAAVSSLILDLILTAGVYSLIGFEVTPSTIVGFLTILGWALYDVVVVFDKVQENTRGITAGSVQTYSEAANLAVNQTLMRSINTGLVALLPVGGLLFIGAGLLGAGTLKDLGLVLFVGMGIAVFSSIFFATPVLATLKDYEPRIQAHNRRVQARRASGATGRDVAKSPTRSAAQTAAPAEAEATALTGAAPKVGARPAGKRSAGARGGRPGGGNRPGGAKRR